MMIKIKELIEELKKYKEEQEVLVIYTHKGEVHKITGISSECGIVNPNYPTLFIYTEYFTD